MGPSPDPSSALAPSPSEEGVPVRTTRALLAGIWTLAGCACLAKLPALAGATLGLTVPRLGVAALGAGATAAMASWLTRSERSRHAPWLAAALTLAAFAALPAEIPRRRGVLFAAAAAFSVLVSQRWLRGAHPWGRASLGIGIAVALGLTLGARDAAPIRTSTTRAAGEAADGLRSVVLLTLDTTRADALGAFGAEGQPTPHLDALAASGIRFTSAAAAAPHTHPSVASMLTGQSPLVHGSVSGAPHLRPGVATLAELAQAEGMATAGFLDNPWLGEDFGLARGYGHLESSARLDRIADWLDSVAGQPYFLHVHLFDPHGPYELRESSLGAVARPEPTPLARGRVQDPFPARAIRAGEVPGRHGLDAGSMEWLHTVHLTEVHAMDAWIGELVAELSRHGRRPAMVVAADHGEEFGEHGSLHHSHTLFEELLHVPLIVSPGEHPEQGVRASTVHEPVSLVDVAPTVAELAGLPPLGGISGRSLLGPERQEKAPTPRSVAAYRRRHAGGRELMSIRRENWKLHLRVHHRELLDPDLDALDPIALRGQLDLALFHLGNDPGEKEDVAHLHPAQVSAMLALPEISAWLQALAEDRSNQDAARDALARRPPVPEGTRERLNALGYGGR